LQVILPIRHKRAAGAVQRAFLPNRVLLFKPVGSDGERLAAACAYTQSLLPVDQQPTVYICENYACHRPITDVEQLRQNLGGSPTVA